MPSSLIKTGELHCIIMAYQCDFLVYTHQWLKKKYAFEIVQLRKSFTAARVARDGG